MVLGTQRHADIAAAFVGHALAHPHGCGDGCESSGEQGLTLSELGRLRQQ